MRRLTLREKKIAAVTMVTVIVSGLYHFIGRPFSERIAAENREIASLSRQLQTAASFLDRKRIIAQRYHQAFASLIPENEPQGDVFVDALSAVESMAQESGITVIDIRPQRSAGAVDVHDGYAVSLQTQGDMEGYVRFLYALGYSEALLRVKKASFVHRSSPGIIDGMFVLSDICASGYSQKEQTARAVSIDSAAPRPALSFYTEAVRRNDVFGALFIEQESAPVIAADEVLKSIVLLGVISGNDPQAVLEDTEKQKTYYVREGERLGMCFVERIEQGKIFLRVEGRTYEVHL